MFFIVLQSCGRVKKKDGCFTVIVFLLSCVCLSSVSLSRGGILNLSIE